MTALKRHENMCNGVMVTCPEEGCQKTYPSNQRSERNMSRHYITSHLHIKWSAIDDEDDDDDEDDHNANK